MPLKTARNRLTRVTCSPTVRTPAADFGEIKPSYWSHAWRTRRTPCTIWWAVPMPRLSYFYGIKIALFWREHNHPVAHFHAEYGSTLHPSRSTARCSPAHSPARSSGWSVSGRHCTRSSCSPIGRGSAA